MASAPNERLAAAQNAVDHACELLLTPTLAEMDACTPLLERAVAELEAFHNKIRANSSSDALRSSNVLTQARLLNRSIGCAVRLLESAAAFHVNWMRFLGALCAGYTGQGQPALVDRRARLLAKG